MPRSRRLSPASPPSPPSPPSPDSSDLSAPPTPDAMDLESDHDHQDPGARELQFHEALSWRPGKPIAVSTLLSRLPSLLDELTDLEQESVVKESLHPVAHDLAHRNLVQHKDAGVRAYVAACLVDILRLCAPDAPFTEEQLQHIFTLFIRDVLPALQDPSHAYHSQHKYVLISLSEVKSVLLLNDIDQSDDLFLRLISACFDCITALAQQSVDGDAPKDIELHMTQIVLTLIDESPGIPASVIDIIMAQFLRAIPPGTHHKHTHTQPGSSRSHEVDRTQSTLLPTKEPAAYVMAKAICHECPEKMARYISQYFNDVIIDASSLAGPKTDLDDDDNTPNHGEIDLHSLHRAHLLIRELWRVEPTVLQNVIPLVEAELSADTPHFRWIATETIGDMISGMGAAGPPLPPRLEPSAYPPPLLHDDALLLSTSSVLNTPLSPQSFAQTHGAAYSSFLSRRNDKAANIRSAWVTEVGYILATSAGGIGLSREAQTQLVQWLAEKLNDADEKVRLAAVKAVGLLSARDLVGKVGAQGDVHKAGSVLANLSDRCRDRKPAIRVEAMVLMAKVWASCYGEVVAGQESSVACVADLPSCILRTFYANDPDVTVLIERVTYEFLLPLTYPRKPKQSKTAASAAAAAATAATAANFDADQIRAERILALVQSLDPAAKKAFFVLQNRQSQFAKTVEAFLNQCERFQGGTMAKKEDEKTITGMLNKLVDYLAQLFPDPPKVATDLQRFAKANDRRNYQLIRFAVGMDNDYKVVHGAIKELLKRLQGGTHPSMVETFLPLMYSSAWLVLNRSHLPTMLECAHQPHHTYYSAAQDMVAHISQKIPDLFKTHVDVLYQRLEEKAPGPDAAAAAAAIVGRRDAAASGVIDLLKAMASYTKKYPEDVPKDDRFTATIQRYIDYGHPAKAARYATDILLARDAHDAPSTPTKPGKTSKTDKTAKTAKTKESRSSREETVERLWEASLRDLSVEDPRLVTKLATISRLVGEAPSVVAGRENIFLSVIDLVLREPLPDVGNHGNGMGNGQAHRGTLDNQVPVEARVYGIKVLVHRVLAMPTYTGEAKKEAEALISLLVHGITHDGDFGRDASTKAETGSRSGSGTQAEAREEVVFAAAHALLKLCTKPALDDLLSPTHFHQLAYCMQHPQATVRERFATKLQKYLSHGKLRHRFYTILFLAAFEPMVELRKRIETWIRSRVAGSASGSGSGSANRHVMESLVARLISLLAHHPDYEATVDSLVDHVPYFVFYLQTVASEENIGVIARYAERVKQTRDAIPPANGGALDSGTVSHDNNNNNNNNAASASSDRSSTSLYVVSDLAQLVIRKWQEKKNWTMSVYPDKIGLPTGLYLPLGSHDEAQRLATQSFLPEGVEARVDRFFREGKRSQASQRSVDVDRPSANRSVKKKTGEGRRKVTSSSRKSDSGKGRSGTKRKPSGSGYGGASSSKKRKSSRDSDDEEEEEEEDEDEERSSARALARASARRSERVSRRASVYRERGDDEDDEEMLEGVAEWEYGLERDSGDSEDMEDGDDDPGVDNGDLEEDLEEEENGHEKEGHEGEGDEGEGQSDDVGEDEEEARTRRTPAKSTQTQTQTKKTSPGQPKQAQQAQEPAEKTPSRRSTRKR